MNKSDSERIAAYLEDLGYVWQDVKEQADLVVTTTCGIKQTAEDRAYGLIPRIKKINPKVKTILTGCLANREDVRRRLKNSVDIWLPINELPQLADKLKVTNKFDGSLSGYLAIEPKVESQYSALVPIGNGCNNFCTYCVVPYARGREVYRPAEEIFDEVRGLVKRGYKEITLIAQNVNSYKSKFQSSNVKSNPKSKIQNTFPAVIMGLKSGEINFAQLLKLVNDIPGDFWLRFSTSHPKDMSDDLIKILPKCEKLCHHIHLPVQSGDDQILAAMNRKYDSGHYLKLIEKIKKVLPDVSLTTDIIVGFPGETKTQFRQSLKLAQTVGFDNIFIGQYSPRPYTAAYKLKNNVTKTEKKRREEELMKVLRKTAKFNSKKDLGKNSEVLVDVYKKGNYYGRTRIGKNVKILTDKKLKIGEFVNVKIIKAMDFGMDGELTE